MGKKKLSCLDFGPKRQFFFTFLGSLSINVFLFFFKYPIAILKCVFNYFVFAAKGKYALTFLI